MRRLVVLGCSATKRETGGKLPAIDLYDGPMYRVMRSFLRTHAWPKDLSVAVLSAEHGLIGGLTPIETYDNRMTRARATQLSQGVGKTLTQWQPEHGRIELVLGKNYMGAIRPSVDRLWPNVKTVQVAEGPIGMKLSYLSKTLRTSAIETGPRTVDSPSYPGRPAYFLPDWDDFVDAEFDFNRDEFSTKNRAERNEVHCSQLVAPHRLADGILVSLAQSFGTKGILRALEPDSAETLSPKQVREHFGLAEDQWAFGDCGAFSYVNEDNPTMSVERAVATYELYGFDLGASVDHIPVPFIMRDGKRVELSESQRRRRVRITKENAEAFLAAWRVRECRFHPVGIVQALSPRGYAETVAEYAEMGYRRVALGGLVPKSDAEIEAVVKAVAKKMGELRDPPWWHLMGIYRPKLQATFRECNVNSFDSATYFRKAWLRSDQNYMGADGNWYAAIRVPPSHDPRTAKRLEASGVPMDEVRRLEKRALTALKQYQSRRVGVDKCLDAVLEYDELLSRGEYSAGSMEPAYRKTLLARPWEMCNCGVCTDIGVHGLVFRGLNRNKRRGAHNTFALYQNIAICSCRP
ncbi:MAG: hypothetical protein NCW75_04180 [Phycisphaera sp.]|nr:MAG: hypothetical protein NCW75_04180 [Phycisphaera sp.]